MTHQTDPLEEMILAMSEEELIQMTIDDGLDPDEIATEVQALLARLEAEEAASAKVVDLAAHRPLPAAPDAGESDGAPTQAWFRMAARPLEADPDAAVEPSIRKIVLRYEIPTGRDPVRLYEGLQEFYVELPAEAAGASLLQLGDHRLRLTWVEAMSKFRIEGLDRPTFADFVDAQGLDPGLWRVSWT